MAGLSDFTFSPSLGDAGARQWRVCDRHNCGSGCPDRLVHVDQATWEHWLRRLDRDLIRRWYADRGLCRAGHRAITDHRDWVRLLARELLGGRFKICAIPFVIRGGGAEVVADLPARATPEPIGAAVGRVSEPVTVSRPTTVESFADDLDVTATVQVLQAAARDGTPFCEECEKARRASATGT